MGTPVITGLARGPNAMLTKLGFEIGRLVQKPPCSAASQCGQGGVYAPASFESKWLSLPSGPSRAGSLFGLTCLATR